MKESLFSYLVSYVPTDKRESKEDYLTQMFAWILKNIEGVAHVYVQYLCEKGNISYVLSETDEIEIYTQTTVPCGRIDLLINVNKEIAFICEHKVFSELSENQINKYMKDSVILGNEKYYSVLLTYSTLQHTQPADISIVWGDIYELFEEYIVNYEVDDKFVIEQFLKYLSENGMGKAELISNEAMLGYWSAMKLENQLDLIFRQLAEVDYSVLCKGIEALGEDYEPTYNKMRWGRIGIDIFKKWNLGLFAGVMLHTENHQLYPKDAQKGPDFVIFLESEYSKTDERIRTVYEKNIHSEGYLKMNQSLLADSGSFEYIAGIKESPWRIAVLRKPLYDILYNTYKQAEQVEAIKSAIVEGMDLLIKGYLQ